MLTRRLAALAALVLGAAALVPATWGAEKWAEPQIKIDSAEAPAPPGARLFVTFLDKQLKPVPLDMVESLEVFVQRGRERPESVVRFAAGVPPKGVEATLTPRAKSESGLGVVVVAMGTLNALNLSSFDTNLRKALASFFKSSFGGADRANVIWYGDDPFTYIPTRGKTKELSNLAQRYDECEKALADIVERPESEDDEEGEVETGGELADLGTEACGLVSSHAEISGIIELPERQSAWYPDVFGLDDAFPLCQGALHERPKVPTGQSTRLMPVLGEALRMLVRSGDGLDQRSLVLVTDGRDSYLLRYDDCRQRFRETDCPKKFPGSDKDAQIATQRTDCVNKLMSGLIVREQTLFADHASAWLALARAAGIRIHAVGIRSGLAGERDFELDRLRVLSLQSGGTYREADEPGEVYTQVMNLADEMSGQYVIDIADAGIEPGEEVSLSVRAVVQGGGTFDTIQSFAIKAATPPTGLRAFAKKQWKRLVDKVGFIWAVVIVVVVALILLLIILWIGIKIIKKIAKAAKGKAKAAAGKAAKAAKAGGK